MKNKSKYDVLRSRIEFLLSFNELSLQSLKPGASLYDKGWHSGIISVLRILLDD